MPLGEALTAMPFGDVRPGMNAGPTFELFYGSGYQLPHRQAASRRSGRVSATGARPENRLASSP